MITSEEYERLKTAPPIHPNEPERARRYREAYAKEQKRMEREQRLRDVLGLIELVKLGSSPSKIEEYIVGDKIDLLEYNKQLEKELGINEYTKILYIR